MNLFDYVNGELDEKFLDAPEGTRLKKLELYNWGTFDEKVWKYTPDGNASLITGQPGSGKSTIVDALTTLLVRPKKVAYNKAADASAKERSTRTYALGYYGRKHDTEGKGIRESLRDENSYSVILATFEDKALTTTTTLATFFWFKDVNGKPESFYVVSKQELFITEHFTNFNSDVRFLKDRLKKQGAMVFDKFSHYSEEYRKQLGNLSEQAVDLFQHTISMKNVQDLNNFVRTSMLEKEDIDEKITSILSHYENLNSTYESVLKAKAQIKQLQPICNDGIEYTDEEIKKFELDLATQSIEYWFARKNVESLKDEIELAEIDSKKIEQEVEETENRQKYVDERISTVTVEIQANGGGEIERLESEVKNKTYQLERVKSDLQRYNEQADILGLEQANSLDNFNDNIASLDRLSTEITEENNNISNRLSELAVDIDKLEQQKVEYDEEIKSLSERRSNIPKKFIDLRGKMCEHLKISEELLPFAGEILEVKESELKWEGAIERLTNSFAISLLVTENYYSQVAEWVNSQHLGMKFVYYKVSSRERVNSSNFVDKNSVASKLDVKQGTTCTEWVISEINERFSHICCEDIEDFKRQNKAISLTGQIKSKERHEKDDRRKVDDRTNYVLGFSNKKKLEQFRELAIECKNKLANLTENKKQFLENQSNMVAKLNALVNIKKYDSYAKLDTKAIITIIEDAKKRIDELKNSNDKLLTLNKTLEELKIEKDKLKSLLSKLNQKAGGLKTNLDSLKEKQENCENILSLETEKEVSMYNFLDENFKTYLGDVEYSTKESERLEKLYKDKLSKEVNGINDNLKNLKSKIEKNMDRFINEYPSETIEMTSNVKSLREFSEFLRRLEYDNLPKFQDEFKQELRSGVIGQIAIFNGILKRYSENIQKRINDINESLYSIDYNKDRYITIICENTTDSEVREFIQQLKVCTEGVYSGATSEEVDESKFKQIKKILERFKGRKEFTYIDEKWTAKVTDVRNWFVFSASERWRESNEEYEHYSDADGKSGGQKEKLAYTILAASLAYNYKTMDKSRGNRSTFRLVVIDEAFLKGSDNSATYGLSLFKKMQFQLIVITPLLKIRTIEPFISHVGFVSHSEITHRSKLSDISIEVLNKKRREAEEM